jgi:hypothetical protein
VQRLLTAVWTHPHFNRLDAQAMLTLADHSLREALFDRALLAPVLPTLRDFVAQAPASMWDVRPSDMGERWHDAYVLRAIDRAGMLADARQLLGAAMLTVGQRKRARPMPR